MNSRDDEQSVSLHTSRPPRFISRTLLFVSVITVSIVVCYRGAEISGAIQDFCSSQDFRALQNVRAFCRSISTANRIVVRDGITNPAHDERVLFTVVDPKELAEVRGHLRLVPDDAFDTRYGHDHICYGFLAIDWYRANERIATAKLMDGVFQDCHSCPPGTGDPHLTGESAAWLRQWLARHGLSEKCLELAVPLHTATSNR